MKPRHLIRSLAAMAATALVLAGCGGASNATSPAQPSGASPEPASGGGSGAVKISNFKFAPATLTVKPGARVTVTNGDSTAHTATADDGQSFDTGTLAPGASHAITVTKPGSYTYHCSIHPFMKGTIVVK